MKSLLRLLLWLMIPGVLVGMPVAMAAYVADENPVLAPNEKPSLDDLRRAQALLAKYDPDRMEAGRDTVVTAAESDLNTAIAAGFARMNRIRSRVAVGQFGLAIVVAAELPVPQNPLVGRYLNALVMIEPSTEGLRIARLSLGRLTVPEGLVVPLIETALDSLIGSGKGDELVNSIKSVAVEGKNITVVYRPTGNAVAGLKTVAHQTMSATDPATVRIYYRKLASLIRARGTRKTSLAAYLGPVFRLARERSRDGDPVAENRAAVLGLSMFFGDRRIEHLIGEVRTPEMRTAKLNTEHVVLQGRHDYMLHFVISAGLALTGGRDIANTVGEGKEIDDTGGKSGFSFTDLAADRAGIRFAELAVVSPRQARRFQDMLAAAPGEEDVFPALTDLPEGLSRDTFEKRFGGTGGSAYREMVAEIDRRIDAVRLYR